MFDIIGFYQKSMRVMNVSSRPREAEFVRMARVTAIGIVAVGVLGVVIAAIFGYI
jgi:protein translocase SEC61 complex gamma subunit